MFNELGKDPADSFDFAKPLNWSFAASSTAGNSSGPACDENNQQYLMVMLQTEHLQDYMKEVEDAQMVDLLKKYYNLDILRAQADALEPTAQHFPNLYIFGSFTSWQTNPYQMQKLFHFATLLSTYNKSEQGILHNHIMDEVNNELRITFNGIHRSVSSSVENWIQLKNA